MLRQLLAIFLPLLMLVQIPMAALAAQAGQAESSPADIDSLTRQVLLQAIELARFNLHYRLEAYKEPRLRELRFAGLQQANASCKLAGSIIATDDLSHHLNSPLTVDKGNLRAAFNLILVGSAVGGSASAVELTTNFLRALRNRSRGYDKTSAIAHVQALLRALDEKIALREQAVAQLAPGQYRQQLDIESSIIRQLRAYQLKSIIQNMGDLSLYTTTENVFYGLNLATNAAETVAPMFLLRGLKHRKYTSTANIIGLVAGSVVTVTPAIATWLGRYMKRQTEREATNSLGEPHFSAPTLETDLALLSNSAPTATAAVAERIGMYTKQGANLDAAVASELRLKNKADRIAVQTNLLAPLIGGATIAAQTLGTVGYFKYLRTARTVSEARHAVGFNYSAFVVSTAVSGLTVGTNGILMALSLLYSRKLQKQKRAPRLLLEQQLAYLDELEKKLH